MSTDFCFSVLALKPKYQLLAKELVASINQYSPSAFVIVGTDNPAAFNDCKNVLAFEVQKKGILHCYHDKRFVIEKALTQAETVIQIDADTKFTENLPASIEPLTGLAATHTSNIVDHVRKYTPERLTHLSKVADKLNVDLATVTYIGESLFAVSGEGEQVSEFIRQWGTIGRYLELQGIHAGSGNAIGLAAAKAKLPISKPEWLTAFKRASVHLDAASRLKSKKTAWDKFKARVDYHYRLNQARVAALKDFDFYYR